MEKVKVRYISDTPSVYFKKGGIYEAYRAKDDRRGLFWCIHIENNDDPGDYGIPAQRFEMIPEGETAEDPIRL